MGVFKKFKNTMLLEGANCLNTATTSVSSGSNRLALSVNPQNFVDIAGTQFSSISIVRYGNSYSSMGTNIAPFAGIQAIATQDVVSDYSYEDYSAVAISGIAVSQSSAVAFGQNEAEKVITIAFSNSSQEDVSVPCVKFTRTVYQDTSLNTLLVGAYYFENPIVVPAGGISSVSIAFKIASSMGVE